MTLPTTDLPVSAPDPHDPGARRTRLREFQTQLMERMQAASSGAAMQTSQLAVMVGQTRWLLNLHEAGEIVSVGSITKVPLTKEWFLGMTNVRGNLVSVVDLARFCGMQPTPVDKDSRIIAFSPALSFNSGLLVSRILGLRSTADMQLEPAAKVDAAPWAVQRYMDRESQVWTGLNLSLIVQDPEFLHVGI